MNKNALRSFIQVAALTWASAQLLPADDPSTAETRLRDALRDTMVQLRDAQNQNFTLQTAQAQSEKDATDLKAKAEAQDTQIRTLTAQLADQKAASDKAVADLNAQLSDLTGQTQRLNDALKEWESAYNQIAQLQKATDAQRVQAAVKAATLQRLVDDRETKNYELYKVGSEILTRYEQFSLGEALEAKEPFVGLARIRLENQVQDYKQKLLDHALTTTGSRAPLANSATAVAEAKPDKATAGPAFKP